MNTQAQAGWFPLKQGVTLSQLAQHIGCRLQAGAKLPSPALLVEGIKPLASASAGDVSFFDNTKYKSQVGATKASAVILQERDAPLLPPGCIGLLTPTPYVAFAKALDVLYPQAANRWHTGLVHPTAVVHPGARLAPGVSVGAFSFIGEHVSVGAGTSIAPHVTIMNAHIGKGCIIHPGVRIGQDGFGFAYNKTDGTLLKVPQVGGVVIGHAVEIGANTTIDCGALENTCIGDMTKIDNLVQIGHNVHIGKMCQIVAQSAIAGSARLGDGVVVGGQSGIAGHLSVASGIMLAARTGVTKSLLQAGGVFAGFPAEPIQQWRRGQAKLARLLRKTSNPQEDTP